MARMANSISHRRVVVYTATVAALLGFYALRGIQDGWDALEHLVMAGMMWVGLTIICFPFWGLFAFGDDAVRTTRRRKWERALTGMCMFCGYDLRASSGRCPECGALIPTPLEIYQHLDAIG